MITKHVFFVLLPASKQEEKKENVNKLNTISISGIK